jgi:hypothetical protein
MIYTTPQRRLGKENTQAVKTAVENELRRMAERDNDLLLAMGITPVQFDAEVALDGIRVRVIE